EGGRRRRGNAASSQSVHYGPERRLRAGHVGYPPRICVSTLGIERSASLAWVEPRTYLPGTFDRVTLSPNPGVNVKMLKPWRLLLWLAPALLAVADAAHAQRISSP